MMMKQIKKLLEKKHFCLIILGIIASIPILINSKIPISHDIMFHLSRIKAINFEMSISSLPILMYHSFIHGMGYASPLFYSDLFMYPFAILYCFLPLTIVYKILVIAINIATVYVISFVLNKLFTNKKVINLGIVIYTFSSYRLVDLYLRGNIGESLCFIFIPLVILGLEEIIHGDKNKYYYLIIGMTGIIYSHIITTYLIGIYILCYLLFNIKNLINDKRYLSLLKSILITFFLTIGFLGPLIEQLIDRNFYIYHLINNDYGNITVPIYKLFLEIPLPAKEWLPLGIGIVYLCFIIGGIRYFKKIKYQDLIYGILGIFFLFCATSLLPNIVYEKLLLVVQYQWRFYILATVCLFIFGLKVLPYFNEKEHQLIKIVTGFSITAVLTVSTTTGFIYERINEFDNEYLGFYEYLPEGITYDDIAFNTISASSNNSLNYEISSKDGIMTIDYEDNIEENTVLTLPLLYYKGYMSNKNYDIINNDGLVAVRLNKQADNLTIYYEGTLITYIAKIVTLMTVLIVISIYIRKRSFNVKIK